MITDIKEIENKIYTLRKVNPNTWSNIRAYNFTNEHIGPSVSEVGLPVTGLTEDTQTSNSKNGNDLVLGTRSLLEKELGLEPGTLKPRSNYWDLYSVLIGAGDEKLDTRIPEHKLKVLFLAAQPQVAFGAKNVKAKSEYVLYTEVDEAVANNNARKTKRQAYELFGKLTLQDRKEILGMVGINANSLTEEIIENKLNDILEEYPQRFMLLANDPTRKQQAFIRDCLMKNIITIDGGTVMYNEVMLGVDVKDAAIKVFSEGETVLRESLKKQLNGK